MMRLPGDDLINVYPHLTDADKKSLANEMINIQALCASLHEGPGYGILDSYNDMPTEKTWYEFLFNRLELYKDNITKSAVFNPHLVTQVLNVAKDMEEGFSVIQPRPFLWDASERNVLVHNGKITGIVDVDEICFGDPLLGSVDNSSLHCRRPAACPRDPEILSNGSTYCTGRDRSGSRGQAAGRRVLNCQQTLQSLVKFAFLT